MLSRLFKSAKGLLSQPQTEFAESTSDGSTSSQSMVTPRSRTPEEPEEELTDENSINVYVPTPAPATSSRKRTRQAQDLDMEDGSITPSAKKRKLPVRAKNSKSPKRISNTVPVVEIPVKKIGPITEVQDSDGEESDEEPRPKPATPKSAAPKSATPKPATPKPATPKSKHRKFGSEEPEEVFSTARQEPEGSQGTKDTPQVISSDEDSDEDSDDEAPEAVNIQDAAETVKAKEREAAQAVKEQLSATRRKRKEREENLKKQAAATEKRKQDLEIVEEAEMSKEDPEEPAEDSNDVEDRVLMELDEPSNPVLSARGELPDLLPAEYLEDTVPRELIVHPAATSRETKAKKTKFQETKEKLPKDKRIGGTIYRVSKTQSTNLAPKSSFHARSTKEAWLQGRAGKFGHSCRQPMSKGFFKK